MNSVELKNYLLKMMMNHFANGEINGIRNVHSCFWYGVIEAIMNQYMNRADYMEENAIATMQGFIDHGVLNW